DVVLTHGRDVTHIAHLGRSGDTFLNTAIEWRDPHCRIEGCHATDGLEIHHTGWWLTPPDRAPPPDTG
ncbi:MAG: hypothetical protein MUP97_03530, partial [Acidimicrobiia bacterium]|nr:hypothetical protein [Acidimicrobiia bacterium]